MMSAWWQTRMMSAGGLRAFTVIGFREWKNVHDSDDLKPDLDTIDPAI
jgi:hypothetical protein